MKRKEIFEYVRRELDDGYTPGQVEDALVDQGWSREDAEDTIAAVRDKSSSQPKGSVDMSNPEYVGFWKRFLAFILDVLILGIPLIGFGALFALLNVRSLTYLLWVGVIALMIYLEVTLGGTPGKLILGFKIVTDEGRYMEIPEALMRFLGRILSSIPFYLGYMWIGWDEEKQGWHDKIAKTHVVKV